MLRFSMLLTAATMYLGRLLNIIQFALRNELFQVKKYKQFVAVLSNPADEIRVEPFDNIVGGSYVSLLSDRPVTAPPAPLRTEKFDRVYIFNFGKPG